MKEHSTNIDKMNKAVDDSASICNNTAEKVDKLITNSMSFMEKIQSSFESNTAKANKVISSLGSTLKTEKLQDDLAMESKIMDALAVQTKKEKVLSIQLENVEKQVNDLLFKKTGMETYILDVIGILSDIIKTMDSMITTILRKHLAEKLKPVFAMLLQIEGVLESSFILKQGGESMSQSKKEDSKPSAKSPVKSEFEPKGKEKLFRQEPIIDQSEDEEPNENELKRRKAGEAEMDEHQRIVCEAEAKEKTEIEAQTTLESLFPEWTLQRIQNEVEDLPSQYWLKLVMSFEIQNTKDSQLDLLKTPKSFKFRSFVRVVNVLFVDNDADHFLFSFYLKHMQQQYETWSASKITTM
ncbi:unnamed protein product [Lactuca saligna]|uniref:Uncharacterized protein n=1 Tax=Lactuca saligna TaxID=75948 RepID=A0AA35VQN5_LACSI|nr:unnamed protein product [Lactuca saligna]